MLTNTKKILGALAVAGLVATGGSAFTASNTVATGKAGAGAGAITGYAVSGVVYTFADDATVGIKYDTVTFTLSDTATKARARINTALGGTFADCSLNAATANVATDWTCTLTDKVSAEEAVELEVVASNANGTDIPA